MLRQDLAVYGLSSLCRSGREMRRHSKPLTVRYFARRRVLRLMAETTQGWREETVRVAGAELTCLQGGSGTPLLVLHEELGHPGWLRWHSELARTHTVIIPLHPGFGKTPPVEWVRNIRDLAGF